MAFTKPKEKTKNLFQKKMEQKKEETKERKFVGGGWDNTGKYGTFVNLQLNLEKLNELEPDKYGNIKLTVGTRKEKDDNSGQDLYVYVNE